MSRNEILRNQRWRLGIIRHAEEVTHNVAKTCRYFGISRTPFYKWYERYQNYGVEGLKDRSRRPLHSPHATKPEIIAKVVYLRQRGEYNNPFLFVGRQSGNNKPISKGMIYHLFRMYAKNAAIPPDKRFVHILKHSIAVHLLNAGWDIIDVQDWLGHKDIKNTAIYGKISNKRREKQLQKLLKSKEIANTLVGIKA